MVKNRGGFTLFEVMITMAVSGAMLVMAIIMFGGQQRKVQFSQSVRDLKQSIQDVINDTSTGYFPNSTLNCTPGVGAEPTVDNSVSVEQGANQGCVFLGKAIHLKSKQMDVYPIVGNRVDASGSALFKDSYPKVVTQLVDTKQYQWDVDLYQIWWGDMVMGHLGDSNLLVFASTPNGTGAAVSGDYHNSGVQKFNAYSSSPTMSVDETSSASVLDGVMRNALLTWPANGEITLCIQDAPSGQGGRQYAGIVVSGGNGGTSVRQQVEADTVRCS